MQTKDFTQLLAAIDGLSASQVARLTAGLASVAERRAALSAIASRAARTPPACPCCGKESATRWGYTKFGLQRWRCCGCGKTFSVVTGRPMARVRRPDKFGLVLRNMMSAHPSSCRVLAADLGLDKMTIWRWRHLILETLGAPDTAPPQGIVEACETALRESRKRIT